MIKAKAWRGKDLTGEWRVYRKLDGVRALVIKRGPGGAYAAVSRNGKPLFNLDHLVSYFTDAEVWLGSFKKTIKAVKTHATVAIPRSDIYQLDPPDRRLFLCAVVDPTAAAIRALLKKYKRAGEDGLVLRTVVPRHLARRGVVETWLKVKHEETYDVRVTAIRPGKGKHRGRMGALETTMGRVGTGFSDSFRIQCREDERGHPTIVGKVIEVACTQLTPNGKFRHARFVRVREDR